MALRHWLQLSFADGVGPILARRLIEVAGSVEAVCAADMKMLQQAEGVGSIKGTKLLDSIRKAANLVDAELERAATAGVDLLCPDDPRYPVMLHSIPDPPSILYMKGSLEDRDLNGIAIVGSRKCSHYGREQAERFGALLAGAGFTVISGGARGVDSCAHRGAMQNPNGRTIAVLGSGIDVTYPPENVHLFEQIAEHGAVLSEYAMGTPPLSDNFPRRNRIVSGMSRGVLVIEADERSGALITARQACDDHGRPVFAIPGRVDNPLSRGPHKLIREGAALTTCIEDIIDGLGPLPRHATEPMLFEPVETPEPEREPDPEPIASSLSDRQKLVLKNLGKEATTVDAIIERTELPASTVLQELTYLSLKGLVKRIDGQSYSRR